MRRMCRKLASWGALSGCLLVVSGLVACGGGSTASNTPTPNPPPTISSVAPNSGPPSGGTPVAIGGTNFRAGATVTFGGTAADGITVVSSAQINATTPAHAAGAVDVVVRNSDGQSATLTGGFTYVPPPTVTSVSPTSGSTVGGTAVTITGTGFQNGATVSFGGLAASVTSSSATQVQANTPAHAAGTVDVTVTNPDGQSGTRANAFTYVNPAPTITGVSPSSGTIAGGTVVTITGTGFLQGATVTFGGTAATGVTVNNSTQITATTLAHAAGVVDVQVTNPDNTSATATSAFTFGVVQIGCGADCGNVGDPYEGGSPAAGATLISACGSLSPTSGEQYRLTQLIGSDAAVVCLDFGFTNNSFTLDLGGHTITGRIQHRGNPSGTVIFNGTVNCDFLESGSNAGCIRIDTSANLTSQFRAHHLNLNQSHVDGRSIHVEINSTADYAGGGSGLGKGVRLDHITAASPSQPTSPRNVVLSMAGNGHQSFEADHVDATCPADAAACQGIAFINCKNVAAHNNKVTMVQNTTAANGRGILCDAVGKPPVTGCEIYANEIVANNNRAMRIRGGTTVSPCGYSGVSIHDNFIRNIRIGGPQAAIHFGENDSCLDVDSAAVFNNTLELNDGNGIVVRAVSGVTISNNTVTCFQGSCASVGWFVFADTPFTSAYGATGTDMSVKNNDVSALPGNAVKVCGPAGDPAFVCSNSSGTTSATVCNTGTVVGNGTITVNTPPCP